MPYSNIKKVNELFSKLSKKLPKHAKDIYKEAFNNAWKQYDKPEERRDSADRDETAHRVAWSAVKRKYKRGEDGSWHKK